MNIVFMGTPAFAVPALEALLASRHKIVSVYTRAPRPAGRGYKEKMSEVHEVALLHQLPVCTPKTLRDPEAQQSFAAWKADIAIVAAYGLLLPPPVLAAYPYGCINIHPSLLPRWRGAAPIQRPILAGDSETGVAIMQMNEGLDTGDVLMMEPITLDNQITAGQLHDRLAKEGAALLLKVLDRLEEGSITATPQGEEGVTYAAKLTKEEGRIHWNMPAIVIDRLIRGMNPWPGAYFDYLGEQIKVIAAVYENKSHQAKAGTILDDQLTIACKEGVIRPTLLQRPGKKAMETAALLRGYPMPAGQVLE